MSYTATNLATHRKSSQDVNPSSQEDLDFFRANDVFVTRYDWDAPLGRRRPSCRELTNGPTSLSMDFLHFGNLGREEGGRESETFRVDVPDAGGQTELGFKS